MTAVDFFFDYFNGYKQLRDATRYLDSIRPIDFQLAFDNRFRRAVRYRREHALSLKHQICENASYLEPMDFFGLAVKAGGLTYAILHPMQMAYARGIAEAAYTKLAESGYQTNNPEEAHTFYRGREIILSKRETSLPI